MKVIKIDTEAHEPWTIALPHTPERITGGGMQYKIALDPDITTSRYLYFIVVCIYEIKVREKTIFLGETQTVFTIESHGAKPTVDFLFEQTQKAQSEFIRVFKEKTANEGNLREHEVVLIKPHQGEKIKETILALIKKVFGS